MASLRGFLVWLCNAAQIDLGTKRDKAIYAEDIKNNILYIAS